MFIVLRIRAFRYVTLCITLFFSARDERARTIGAAKEEEEKRSGDDEEEEEEEEEDASLLSGGNGVRKGGGGRGKHLKRP